MAQVERWLVQSLADRLGKSAVRLESGEYDAARRLLGDEYESQLGRLVEVSGETNTTRTYERTRKNQREVVRGASRYDRTLERYREAREAGNETRARRLARDLQRISRNVNRNAVQTTEGYDRLGSLTGRNFTNATRATTAVAENISQRQAEIREASFVQTDLATIAEGEDVSFVDPLTIRGELSMENETVVADREIALRIGNRTYETTTDGEGEFAVEYRPTLLPANASNVTVEFLPRRGSPYFNSTDSLPVSVEQVEPNVAVERSPKNASFGTPVTVSGRVTAADRGVRVPVAIRIANETIARGMPSDDGRFAVTVPLPASVPAGNQSVVAVTPLRGRAIASAAANATLSVASTPTRLALNGTQVNESAIAVDGRLTTDDGRPVVNRSVELALNGTVATTVRTDENGTFETTVPIPESRRDDATLLVGAAYGGGGTSLEAARAKARVELATAGESLLGTAALALGALLLLALALGGWYLHRRDEETEEEVLWTDESSDESDGTVDEPTAATEGSEHSLDRARELIERGETNSGVVTAYLAVRERLSRRGDVDRGRTHWEFYAENVENVSADEADSLQDLTRAYERAAFAPGRLPESLARRVVDAAGRFDGSDDEPTEGTTAD